MAPGMRSIQAGACARSGGLPWRPRPPAPAQEPTATRRRPCRANGRLGSQSASLDGVHRRGRHAGHREGQRPGQAVHRRPGPRCRPRPAGQFSVRTRPARHRPASAFPAERVRLSVLDREHDRRRLDPSPTWRSSVTASTGSNGTARHSRTTGTSSGCVPSRRTPASRCAATTTAAVEVRARREAVRHRRRRAAAGSCRTCWTGRLGRASRRPVRRPRARRRAPDRRDPAAQRRRLHPAGQPILRRRADEGGEVGANLRKCSPTACATPSAWPSTRGPATCGSRRTATTLQRDQPRRGGDERGLGADHGPGRRIAQFKAIETDPTAPAFAPAVLRPPADSLAADEDRRHPGRPAAAVHAPRRDSATRSSAGSSRCLPAASASSTAALGRIQPATCSWAARATSSKAATFPPRTDRQPPADRHVDDPRLRIGSPTTSRSATSPRAKPCSSAELRRRHRYPDRPERQPVRRVARSTGAIYEIERAD